ncbi:MAG TPA: hypothetical protein VMM36_07295 [Opitutaceae bacterium]|nr:hypothetical protein [Opitutaceae bacterium]
MNASQIISEISSLPPDEQAKVVRFAYSLDAERKLKDSLGSIIPTILREGVLVG